jgi:hypothetical protein
MDVPVVTKLGDGLFSRPQFPTGSFASVLRRLRRGFARRVVSSRSRDDGPSSALDIDIIGGGLVDKSNRRTMAGGHLKTQRHQAEYVRQVALR